MVDVTLAEDLVDRISPLLRPEESLDEYLADAVRLRVDLEHDKLERGRALSVLIADLLKTQGSGNQLHASREQLDRWIRLARDVAGDDDDRVVYNEPVVCAFCESAIPLPDPIFRTQTLQIATSSGRARGPVQIYLWNVLAHICVPRIDRRTGEPERNPSTGRKLYDPVWP